MSGTAIQLPDDHGSSLGSTNISTISVGAATFGAVEAGRNGTTIPDRDYDWYKIYLSAGTGYTLQSQTVASNALNKPLYSIIDSSGKEVAGTRALSMSSEEGRGGDVFMVSTSGYYYVNIFSSCCVCTGYYGFTVQTVSGDDHLGGVESGTSLAIGASAPGAVQYSGDRDGFKVDLVAGKTYVFTADSVIDGQKGTLRDPFLRLLDANGKQLAFNDDTSIGGESVASGFSRVTNNSLIQYTATTSGTYYLDVSAAVTDMRGAYKVSAQEITVDADGTHTDPSSWKGSKSSSTFGALTVNGSGITGTINHAGDRDWYKVNLDADVKYMLRVQSTGKAGSIEDAVIRLFDTSTNSYQFLTYNNTASNDPLGLSGAKDALILFKPTVAGTYYIEASDAGNASGQYVVSVAAKDDAAGSTSTIQKVQVNQRSVSGQIETIGDSDWYSVFLTEGVTYRFDARQSSLNGLADPFLNLRGLDGAVLASNDNGNGRNAVIEYTATRSGLFYLDVQDAGLGLGRYSVSATAFDDDDIEIQTLSVPLGLQSISGSIDFGGDIDSVLVELEAGQTYTLSAIGAASGTGLSLANPRILGLYTIDGDLLRGTANDDFGNSRDAQIRFRADRDGVYVLQVAGSALSDVGSYRLSLDAQTLVDVAGSTATRSNLALGGVVKGVIDENIDKDWHRVQLEKGKTYVVELLSDVNDTQPLWDPKLGGIYDASGTLIAGTTQDNYGQGLNSRLVFTATNTGTYYLEASAGSGRPGAYQLGIRELSQTNDTVGSSIQTHAELLIDATAASGAIEGTIDGAGDIDWYRVELEAGQRYEITLRGAASGMGSLLDARLQGIYDTGGALVLGTGVHGGDGGTEVRSYFTPTASGNYFVAAAGTAGGTGSFRLELRHASESDDIESNENTRAVLNGGAFSSQIDELGDTDWIRVELDAYSKVNLTLKGVAGSMGRLADPYIGSVFDASGDAVLVSRWGSIEGTSVVTFETTKAGTYFIQAESMNGRTGGYQLSAQQTAIVNLAPELMDPHIDHDPSKITKMAGLVALDGVITLHFGKPIAGVPGFYAKKPVDMLKGSGKIYIAGNGQQLEIDVNSDQVVVSGNTVTIKPNVPFLPDTDYGVIIDPGTFVDVTGAAFQGIGVARETIYQTIPAGELLTTAIIYSNKPASTFADTVKKQIKNELFWDPDEFIFRTVAPTPAAETKAAWHLMVYMAADNELEPAALDTLRELTAAQYGDNVKVSVLIDRAAGYANGDGDGDWTGAYQGVLSSDVTLFNIPQKWADLGEVNTGDPSVLTSFVQASQLANPAQQHGLIIWGPGGGLSGTAWDDSAGMDSLSPAELTKALSDAGLTKSFVQAENDDKSSRLQVTDAYLTQGGSAIQLNFNYNLWDPSWQLLPYKDIDYSSAFQYSLDNGQTWQKVGSASIVNEGITLSLGSLVPFGTEVQLRYDADQRFTYVDSTSSGSPTGSLKTSTWGALLLADGSFFRSEGTSVNTYFYDGFPKENVVSAKDFNLTIKDNRLNLLSFDSSEMGLLEMLAQMQPHAHTLVASQGELAITGLDYTAFLNRLGKASSLSGDQLAKEMVNIYKQAHGGTNQGSLSAYALDGVLSETRQESGRRPFEAVFTWSADLIASIAGELSSLGEYMVQEATTEEWEFVREALQHVISRPSADSALDHYRDLSDFLQYLTNITTSDATTVGVIGSTAITAKVALDQLVLASSRADSDSQGLGVYLPSGQAVSGFYNSADLTFLKFNIPQGSPMSATWLQFVAKMQEDLTNTAPTNLVLTVVGDVVQGAVVGSTISYTLPEQTGEGSAAKLKADLLVGTLEYTDTDAWTSGNQYTLSGPDAALFRVLGDGLYLRQGVSLDFEGAKKSFEITVEVSDTNLSTKGSNNTKTFTVNLENKDENTPVFVQSAVSVAVAENTPTSSPFHTAAANDAGDPGALVYSLKPTGDHTLFNLNAATGQLTFKSAPDYEARDLYSVTIVATDSVGKSAEQVVMVNVTDLNDGGADTRAPEIRTFSPADDASKVALNAPIVLTFNENVVRGTGTIVLKTLSGTVVETFGSERITISGDTVTLDPTAQLANNTGYVVSLAQDALKDSAGNSMAAVSNYNFRTIKGIAGFATAANDTTAPTAQYLPADDATGVAVDAPIVLTFNEAIQRGTGSISLVKYNVDNSVTTIEAFDVASSNRLTVTNTGSTYTLSVDPTATLNLNTQYGLVVGSGAVVDAAGNAYVDQGGYSFTTGNKGAFNITLEFKSVENITATGWTENVMAMFQAAADAWEKVIVGDLPDVNGIDDLRIEIYDKKLTVGNLGYGGFSELRSSDQGSLPYLGSITVDLSQGDTDSLKGLIQHEMGHVLGIGSLWGIKGFNSVFGQYTGDTALTAYQMLSSEKNALFVPLETGGGAGTANVHWLEELFGNELMTGYQDASTAEQTSLMTVATLADLGYQVNFGAADLKYKLAGQTLAPSVDVEQLFNNQSAMNAGVYVL